MSRKKILIICFKGLKASRRSYRQILALKDEFEVYTIGYDDAEVEGVKFYQVAPAFKVMGFFQKASNAILFLLGLYNVAYKRLYNFTNTLAKLKNAEFDLVIVHDLKPFPLLDRLNIKAPVICDAHEYYYDRNGGTLLHRLLIDRFDKYLLKRYFEKQKIVTTVGEWIADRYKQILPEAKVDVITSAAAFYDLQPSVTSHNKIRVIHHGIADPHRKTHVMIEMADYLDERFEVELMLVNNTDVYKGYYNELIAMCASRKNVRIIDPVEPHDIVPYTSKYDIGLFLLPSDKQTHMYALPNKFFEFIQARLVVAVSPNPEMARYVNEYNLGVVSETFEPKSMAIGLNALTIEKIKAIKDSVNKAASVLNAEEETRKFKNIVNTAISNGK